MISKEILEGVSREVGFSYHPELSRVSDVPQSLYGDAVIEEIDQSRYMRVRLDERSRVKNDTPLSFTLETLDAEGHDTPDKNMHGNVEDYLGITVGDVSAKVEIINAPWGANAFHAELGRDVGGDIPEFIEGLRTQDRNSVGEVIEALANMQVLVPGIDNFEVSAHDLSSGYINHGLQWPHTHPQIYKDLQKRAHDLLATYGDALADQEFRPADAVELVMALDGLHLWQSPSITRLATAEHGIREDQPKRSELRALADDVVMSLLASARIASGMLYAQRHVEGSERDDAAGYAKSLVMVAGVVAGRIALHETFPHENASRRATSKTLSMLRRVQKILAKEM